MNILELKRVAAGNRLRWNDGGAESTGTGDGYGGGLGDGYGDGGGSLGLSDYGALADAATGYSPATGYTTTQVSDPGLNNYGYSASTANQDRTNVGIYGVESSRDKSVSAKINEFLQENPLAKAALSALGLPGLAVGLAAKLGEKYGGTYTDAEVNSALASGGVNGFTRGDGGNVVSTGGSGTTSTPATTTPSVIDALAGTLSLSSPSSGWGDYVKNTLPGLQTQATQAGTRGNAAYDTAQTQSGTSMGLANMMNQDYANIYRPFGQQMANEVNNLNSEGYLSQQRGKAMADVQQQSDAQMQSQQRNLQRMGVNPSSGRMLAMGNQNAIATAAAKAGAAGQSDAYNKQNYIQGLSSMNNFGSALQTQARANNSQAMDWSKYGLTSGMTGLGANMDVSKLTTGTAGTYGSLANGTLAAQTGATNSLNAQNNYNDSNNLGNLAKSAAVGYAVKGLGNYLFG